MCVQSHVHESVHISAAKTKLFYFCWGFFPSFSAIKKTDPRDFVWVIVQLFLYKSCEQRLKEQNIPLLHYTAMPSGCRSSTVLLLLSDQLHILGTPAPTVLQLHPRTLESTSTAEQGGLPGSSLLLDWRDSMSSSTRRAQHRYLQVKICSHCGAG